MSKFNSVTEQLNSKECKLVLGICGTARTKNHRIWKELDVEVGTRAGGAVAQDAGPARPGELSPRPCRLRTLPTRPRTTSST